MVLDRKRRSNRKRQHQSADSTVAVYKRPSVGERGEGEDDSVTVTTKPTAAEPASKSYETQPTTASEERDSETMPTTRRCRRSPDHVQSTSVEESLMLIKNFDKEIRENPDNLLKLYHPEPVGNPGRESRRFFMDYYGR